MVDIKDKLNYDPLTGVFTWKVRVNSKVPAGTVAGSPHNKGYLVIRYNKKPYLAHRLAFWWMNGYWPFEVDHRNRVKTDNRILNLRESTRSANNLNKPSKNLKLHKPSGLWNVVVQCGEMRHSSYYKDRELAELVAAEVKDVFLRRAYGGY